MGEEPLRSTEGGQQAGVWVPAILWEGGGTVCRVGTQYVFEERNLRAASPQPGVAPTPNMAIHWSHVDQVAEGFTTPRGSIIPGLRRTPSSHHPTPVKPGVQNRTPQGWRGKPSVLMPIPAMSDRHAAPVTQLPSQLPYVDGKFSPQGGVRIQDDEMAWAR